MSTQRVTGIEAAQLRALTDHLDVTEVEPDAAIAITLTDAVLHVQVDHPDDERGRTWLVIDVDSTVLPSIGPGS
jgi:hypothetical protein